MRSLLLGFAGCVLSATLAGGCVSSPASPTNNGAFSSVDLSVGTGAAAQNGQSLSVYYTGWLFDTSQPGDKGAVFDASGTTAFTFTLGGTDVISGWNQGLTGMQVGGIRRLVIPPSLAYGGTRKTSIPPNATLLFEVQLLSIN
jgi:FKBP-type peptidyl-prolyl cis-trans isomerase FkpA